MLRIDAAAEDISEYLDFITQLDQTELTASIPIKPSQIAYAGDGVFVETLGRIIKLTGEETCLSGWTWKIIRPLM